MRHLTACLIHCEQVDCDHPNPMSTMKPENTAVSRGDRRQFVKASTLATFSAMLGMDIPFGGLIPQGLTPVALGQDEVVQEMDLIHKPGLRVLNLRPVNMETPALLLDDEITPNQRHFVRNNGLMPERAGQGSLSGWTLDIDGEVERPMKLSMDQLQSGFKVVEGAYVLECGGNGRAGFYPPAPGNQWTLGAVGCALYKGIRLRDVLLHAGLRNSAVYIGYYGEDIHLSRDPSKVVISRGFPISKALDEHTLLAWEMNGEPLPAVHGFPLRLICPGWPASTSGKWLKRITVRNVVHDGEKMTGHSYRMPKYPVAPGTDVPAQDMEIISEMPVKSIITFPETGMEVPQNQEVPLRGHAWSGSGNISAMDVSIDFGQTWKRTELKAPRNKFAWQRWNVGIQFPGPGYYEVWARATDVTGAMQPMVVPGWNPRGYLNNAMHRIAIKVTA